MRTMNQISQDLKIVDDQLLQRYEAYFSRLAPKTEADVMRRFLFAYLSIQTYWENNVKLYNRLKDLKWIDRTYEDLQEVFVELRTGLNQRRPMNMWKFGQLYRAHPGVLLRAVDESWQEYRDRLCYMLPGLGEAKAAFVIEMCWPEANVACLDRHMLGKLFGRKKEGLTGSQYRMLERRFCQACDGRKPGLVRLAFWDHLKGQPNPDYWASCLVAS